MSGRVAILFALEREAAPFRRLLNARPNCRIIVTGVGEQAARLAAEKLTSHDQPVTIIMAGFCGALHSEFAVGDVVCAREVLDTHGNTWLCENVGQAGSRLLTVSQLVATPNKKHEYFVQYNSDIVDMESAAVAAVCHARGVPFLAVRAVTDTADTALSPRLMNLLSGGNVSPFRAAMAVLKQPSILKEFRRLARDTKFAARQLAAKLTETTSLAMHIT